MASQIVVADPSQQCCGRRRGRRDYTRCAPARSTPPFPHGSFGCVLVVDAFHHFHDYTRAPVELKRVLTLQRRLVVEEPNIERRPVKTVALGERLAAMRSRFLPPRDMQYIFERQGGVVSTYADEGISAWLAIDKGPEP